MKKKVSLHPSVNNSSLSLVSTGKSTTSCTSSMPATSGPTTADADVDASVIASSTKEDQVLHHQHQFGNFHNYYTFNPSTNRISILEKLKILNYLRTQLIILGPDEIDCNEESDERGEDEKRERKRLKTNIKASTSSKRRVITYCDLGCNEGDLTMSISNHLLQLHGNKNKIQVHDDKDDHHQDHQDHHQQVTTTDVTKHKHAVIIKCLGLDIDCNLIKRANNKYSNNTRPKNETHNHYNTIDNSNQHHMKIENHHPIHATFETCNIANNDEFKSKCQSYLLQSSINSQIKKERFDLISIFSTTMWIHIHHGDDGLKSLLRSICTLCCYILIEPQPSKCYRNVNTRLRKLNLEEIDVSLDRLKMRCDIEKGIEDVILTCGFERVDLLENLDSSTKSNNGPSDRTKWNRTLRLYKWIPNSI